MKKTSRTLLLLTPLVLLAGVLTTSLITAPTASAAEETTWQKFVKKKCAGSTADAAEQCANRLQERLRERCGAPKDTDKYVNCWRTFIRNNGGTAGPNSTPFENETPNSGGTTVNGCTDSNGNPVSTLIKCDTKGGNPVVSMLLQVINFLAVGVGIAVVGGIAWGGMLYASSNGDSSKAKQGITTIVNAVLGLILFMFIYALVNFLVPGGLFN